MTPVIQLAVIAVAVVLAACVALGALLWLAALVADLPGRWRTRRGPPRAGHRRALRALPRRARPLRR